MDQKWPDHETAKQEQLIATYIKLSEVSLPASLQQ